MIKTIIVVVGILLLVSILTYVVGTIYLNIQEKKYKKCMEEEDKKC